MQMQFRSNDPDGARWQQASVQRLHQALRRLQWLVSGVQIRLEDVNGPAGGVDKRCSVEVSVGGAAPMAVTATSRDWQGALELVAGRLRRRVLAQWRRALPWGGALDVARAARPTTRRPVVHRPALRLQRD